MIEPTLGAVIAGHRLERVVGRGGMGIVYEAVELALDRRVALKLIAPELAGDTGFRERFIVESRLAASLDHPNVLPVFGAGEQDGVLYLAMRFVAGEDLRTLVATEGPLPPARAAQVVAQVAAALEAAHARRLVHRDVKPANVLVAGEHAYLTDFGIVKDLAATRGDTRTGQVLGTLDYLAPERIRGEPATPASDVYSLGCVLFFALAGQAPYPLETPEAKLWAHVAEPAPTLPAAPAFDPVLRRALAKDPGERFAPASALGAAALEAATAAPAPLLERARTAAAALSGARPDLRAPLDRLLATLAEASDGVGTLAPADVEQRLTEIRTGPGAGKAERIDALAQALAAQRRLERIAAALEAGPDRDRLEALNAEASGLAAGRAP